MLLSLLRDESVATIVAGRRDWFARFGAPYVEVALSVSGRRLLVVDSGEEGGDLVGDVREILTLLCARLYGKGVVVNRAARALACLDAPDVEVVS
jgi:predicted site-specific integrase-resolvase